MKDWVINSKNPLNGGSINHCFKSRVYVKSQYSSSSESLLTLLNASIEHQQASFKSLSQMTMNMSKSKHSSKRVSEDKELELHERQHVETKLDNESQHEESLKKKKTKHIDCEVQNSTQSELEIPNDDNFVLPKIHKKMKHKNSSISEAEDNSERNDLFENKPEKSKKKKHFAEMEDTETLKLRSPDIVEPVLHKSHKKSKKGEYKNSSISEIEDNSERNATFENKPEKSKKKKHFAEMEDTETLKLCSPDILEPVLHKSHKKSKKREHKNSSISEIDNSERNDTSGKTKKKKHFAEMEDTETLKLHNPDIVEPVLHKSHKKSKKSKHKHSSISEIEDNSERNATSENKLEKTKKKKHFSEMENTEKLRSYFADIDEPVLNKSHQKSKKRKNKNPSISEIEDNSERNDTSENKPQKTKKKKHFAEVENTDKLQSCFPDIDEPVFHKSHKKSKKRKHKHSSISEIEDNSERNAVCENKPRKIKKKKPFAEIENSETLKSCSSDIDELVFHKSHKKSKKGEHKRSSIEEIKKEQQEDDSLSSNYEESNIENDENLKSTSPGKVKIAKRISRLNSKIKNTHQNYYLTTKVKSENDDSEDEQDPNKTKVVGLINEALDTSLQRKQFNDTDMSTLTSLDIAIPWELPESHTIETRLSHPTYEQYKQFKELDVPMKSGPYSKEENQKIKDNWEEFCKNHDLKISPLVFFPVEGESHSLLPTRQRINFVRYLGKGLQNRTLCSIYSRFQLLFRPCKKGKFSPEEDNIILTFMENSYVANKYAALGTILNRGRELVKRRYQILKADDEKLLWNMSLLQDLVNILLEVTGKNNVDDLKEFSFEPAHWRAVENKMGIAALKIKKKWENYLYPTLFVEEFHTLNEIRAKLINILDESKEDDRKNINWNELAKNFDGVTRAKLYKIFMDMLLLYVPNAEKTNLRDTVILLKQTLPHMLLRKKVLKKLVHHNGRLSFN